MGFYIRKSVSVGPFRFNLSKGGVGVSTGIKGFRVGTSPRGNYVHMGRGGIYYRATLPSKNNISQKPVINPKVNSNSTLIPEGTHDPIEAIDSAISTMIVDSSSADLVNDLNIKQKKYRIWPFVALIAAISIFSAVSSDTSTIYKSITTTIWIALVAAAFYWDLLRKSTVILYDIEDDFQSKIKAIHDAFDKITNCKKSWHLEGKGKVNDKKYHAGADTLVKRNSISLRYQSPPYVKTNINIPCIPVGSQNLYFFPDKVLIVDSSGVGGISYENLTINISNSQFIESDTVPSDAKIIDYTWQYVNKKGGPDKRFKDNKKLPITLYEELHFSSQTGLNEIIQLSKTEISNDFKSTINSMKLSG